MLKSTNADVGQRRRRPKTTVVVDQTPIRILFSAQEIEARVNALAVRCRDCAPQRLIVVCVLKGGFVFAADLVRALHHAGLAPEIDFLLLSSYGADEVSSGTVKISRDVDSDVTGRDIVLVDDILESGRTLAQAKALLLARNARRVLTCVLIDKQVPRSVAIEADLVGFQCGDEFVIGFGMDSGHKFRQLPYIGVVLPDGDKS